MTCIIFFYCMEDKLHDQSNDQVMAANTGQSTDSQTLRYASPFQTSVSSMVPVQTPPCLCLLAHCTAQAHTVIQKLPSSRSWGKDTKQRALLLLHLSPAPTGGFELWRALPHSLPHFPVQAALPA